ncbi:hypothetical protein AB4212_51290, partial [Streptomyces sp. 2MCAF27]
MDLTDQPEHPLFPVFALPDGATLHDRQFGSWRAWLGMATGLAVSVAYRVRRATRAASFPSTTEAEGRSAIRLTLGTP